MDRYWYKTSEDDNDDAHSIQNQGRKHDDQEERRKNIIFFSLES